MVGFPQDPAALYKQLRAVLRDAQSRDEFVMPAQYMFREIPDNELADGVDPVALVLGELDRHGVDVALVSVSANEEVAARALAEHPDRFVGSWSCDPNRGMAGIRELVHAHETYGIRAATVFPHGGLPQVPIDGPQMYPIYAKCVELGIPIFVTVGIAGPRLPSACQRVELIDQVMYDFPELVFVMRHGAEPWTELAVKLMLKWPNLYYSTSAFAPRYYPADIINYANTRGADKILYGGYFPMGLTLDRIMAELPHVGLKDDVWPKFLRHNAARLLGLADEPGR
ncbi:amidohydrolase [Frankia sp. CNm7]|uniref:Amidohydrolase n=1 Tax=Frankia nepalensis TaxID=1836974 RepID=A0A937RFL9_9ACTN|nr:amidohydrolase [Frankia nepalensis]MBL7514721.1 amidohydrolase [Frankia nepalensis]MBL7524572.1 amidohydrolase [Frankia nepalensis]MBL7631278.1 amidohydrolase [Frankia nepalensis]